MSQVVPLASIYSLECSRFSTVCLIRILGPGLNAKIQETCGIVFYAPRILYNRDRGVIRYRLQSKVAEGCSSACFS